MINRNIIAIGAGVLSCITAFSASAEENDILDLIVDGASLRVEQYNKVSGFCQEMNNVVLPKLRQAGVEEIFEARFVGKAAECIISNGDGYITAIVSGDRLQSGRDIDRKAIAIKILDDLSHGDRVKLSNINKQFMR